MRGISQAFKEYKQLKLLKNPIKGIYILLFLLMTLIVVFSFTWFGLYLARGITGPIEQLAEATREVAAGNLGYKVQAPADDEIGVLVDSFNRMTDDLSRSKRQLEEAYLDLQDKHTELEDRRRYIETVLEAITTGVASFDALGRLTTVNGAAAHMFGLSETGSVGRLLEELFTGPDVGMTPVLGLVRGKAAIYNEHLHAIALKHGALVADMWALRVLRDPRMWAPDRLHHSPTGHNHEHRSSSSAASTPAGSLRVLDREESGRELAVHLRR